MPLARCPSDRREDLELVSFPKPGHLGGQRLPGRDGEVVFSMDEKRGCGGMANGSEKTIA
jgi:hypothetical protein